MTVDGANSCSTAMWKCREIMLGLPNDKFQKTTAFHRFGRGEFLSDIVAFFVDWQCQTKYKIPGVAGPDIQDLLD